MIHAAKRIRDHRRDPNTVPILFRNTNVDSDEIFIFFFLFLFLLHAFRDFRKIPPLA